MYILKHNMLTSSLQESILCPNDKTSMEAASSELLMRVMFFLMMLEIQTQNSCGALMKDTQMSVSACNSIITGLTKEVTQVTDLSGCLLGAVIAQIEVL